MQGGPFTAGGGQGRGEFVHAEAQQRSAHGAGLSGADEQVTDPFESLQVSNPICSCHFASPMPSVPQW